MALFARAIQEGARSDATGRRLAFELDEELSAQNIEGFVLSGMGMRRRACAWRNDDFPQR